MNRKVAAQPSSTPYTLKQRILLAILPPIVALAFRTWYGTCRIEVRGREHWQALSDSGQHFFLVFWHESLSFAILQYRDTGFQGLVSASFDGELITRVLKRFRLKTIRGSSRRGGMKALSELADAVKDVQLIGMAVDGPTGPRRKAKPGAAILASKTQLPILPQAFVSLSSWRLKSWDRHPIPKPFSKIVCVYGPPIQPSTEATRAEFEGLTARMEDELNRMQQALEEEFQIEPCLNRE